jgi:hypothetical protein
MFIELLSEVILMANPAIVACPADTWTKVATNVQVGNVWLMNTNPALYLQTYRLTGEAAPTLKSEGVRVNQPGTDIDSSPGIDVYIYAVKNAGSVRVDV